MQLWGCGCALVGLAYGSGCGVWQKVLRMTCHEYVGVASQGGWFVVVRLAV